MIAPHSNHNQFTRVLGVRGAFVHAVFTVVVWMTTPGAACVRPE